MRLACRGAGFLHSAVVTQDEGQEAHPLGAFYLFGALGKNSHDVSVAAPTARIEKALRVTINDYRLPAGYLFWANDRPPTVPAALPIRFILGLSDYHRAMVPGPLIAPTPTPTP